MKKIKDFDEYVKIGTVKKVKENKQRAESLIIESERKIKSLEERLEKIGIRDDNANDYVEYCYDIIMLLIRAKLYENGYNASGVSAHAAEVSYLHVLGFEDKDIAFLDKIRYFRNGMLYYGTILDKEYAEKVVIFAKKFYEKLRKL